MADKELPRRSTGNVVEPGDGYLPNGKPNLAPDAGYDAARPVQYSDESDTMYKIRLAEFEKAELHAQQNAAGGATIQQQKDEAKINYEKELANIDLIEGQEKGSKK